MTLFHRRSVFAFVLGAMLAAAVLVGRSAFATTETISACFKPSNGTLYLLGESSGRDVCQPGDIPISWNTSGVNGQDGVSVTSQTLAPGDANCPNGGSKFLSATGVTYACNGSNGVDGQDGDDGQDGADGLSVTSEALAPGDDAACPNGGTKFTSANGASYACNGSNGVDGQDGEDFSGTFTSPNGQFRLVVGDAGIRLENLPPLPPARIQLTANSVQIQTQGLFSASGAVTTVGGSPLTLSGALINLNGNGCGVLRSTDVNPFIPPTTGGPTLLNPNGSPTVRTTC